MIAEKNLVYGLHAVKSILVNNPKDIDWVWIDSHRHNNRMQEIIHLCKKSHVKVLYFSKEKLDELTSGKHQGVIAALRVVAQHEIDIDSLLQKVKEPLFLLILDGVQDPHNLGACMRTANAAGVHAVVAPKDRAVGITPVVSKVASGAIGNTPFIQVTNLARTLKTLKDHGVWLYGGSEHADVYYDELDYDGSVALILGAEGSGLRRLTQEHCDYLIKIPMFGNVSSLNVSVATGICLYEVLRQRRQKNK